MKYNTEKAGRGENVFKFKVYLKRNRRGLHYAFNVITKFLSL